MKIGRLTIVRGWSLHREFAARFVDTLPLDFGRVFWLGPFVITWRSKPKRAIAARRRA